jgi:integrase
LGSKLGPNVIDCAADALTLSARDIEPKIADKVKGRAMGHKRMTGLIKRGAIWHIDKMFRGTRVRESTSTGSLVKAQEHLAKRIDEIRCAKVYGLRPDRTFRAAATRFLAENQQKRTFREDVRLLKWLDPFIGDLPLRRVHMGSLQRLIAKRKSEGVRARTINNALALIRHILNLAAHEWWDEQDLTWLERAPKIKLIPVRDGRSPYPLSGEEQALLFQELPDHLMRMALFKVNTGCRDREVCGLRWDDEVKVPELNTSVFIIPGDRVKNAQDRLVVLNRIARSVVEAQRGLRPDYVFAYVSKRRMTHEGGQQEAPKPVPVLHMNNSAWQSARARAADTWEEQTRTPAPEGFRRVRVHDLKHTFGRRLRAAGVSFEDRQDLLGHKSAQITTHYSVSELANLIAAAELVCGDEVCASIALRRGPQLRPRWHAPDHRCDGVGASS